MRSCLSVHFPEEKLRQGGWCEPLICSSQPVSLAVGGLSGANFREAVITG